MRYKVYAANGKMFAQTVYTEDAASIAQSRRVPFVKGSVVIKANGRIVWNESKDVDGANTIARTDAADNRAMVQTITAREYQHRAEWSAKYQPATAQ